MTRKKIGLFITAVLLCALILNIEVPTKQGINYSVRTYRIPLYIKIMEFISRDYRYRALAGQITKGKKTETDKAMSILAWTEQNIKTEIPESWPIYDDHIWNIIIRGYGADDQISDVFTTLCMYAGLPAGWARIYMPGHTDGLVLSFVKIGGRWRVFDVAQKTYFVNDTGEIASCEDILSDRYDKKRAMAVLARSGLTYEDYFKNMMPYVEDVTLRSRLQMPFRRALYEAGGILGRKKDK